MICNLCPRQCGAERTPEVGKGWCRLPSVVKVARAELHHWEEPCISGTRGAGTVFFSGCTLGCVFCQNGPISHENQGKEVTEDELYALFEKLAGEGAHNIELVTPTQYIHVLQKVLARPMPGNLPVVWNCGGYERVEILKSLEGKVDVYLPDLKYVTEELAAKYSSAPDYPSTAKAAIVEMFRQTGPVQLEDGILKQGVVIRHLILPGRLAEAKRVMDWVSEQFAPGEVLFSLMAQYTPCGNLKQFPELQRTLRPSELRAARSYMDALGIQGYVQELEAVGEKFIPDWNMRENE